MCPWKKPETLPRTDGLEKTGESGWLYAPRRTRGLKKEVVLVDQVMSSAMCTPRNVVLLTLSTAIPLMVTGGCSLLLLLKSRVIPLLSSTFRERLFLPHHLVSCSISFLYSVSSLLMMRLTTVGSSANLMMWFVLNLAVQSCVSRVNRRGLST